MLRDKRTHDLELHEIDRQVNNSNYVRRLKESEFILYSNIDDIIFTGTQ